MGHTGEARVFRVQISQRAWLSRYLHFFAPIQLNPDALTLATHATPLDAVLIAKDVKSKSTMGIHFATFVGSEDECVIPITASILCIRVMAYKIIAEVPNPSRS